MRPSHAQIEARNRFKETFLSCGSVAETARILGISQRSAHATRRRIEEAEGQPLLSRDRRSADFRVHRVEFPEWQTIEVKNGYVVAFGDAHLIPYERSTAHRALMRLVKELGPEALVDLGDLLDFASISRHHRIGWDKSPEVRQEIEWGSDCLEELKRLGPKRMVTKKTMGNHDQRFSGAMSNQVPQFEGVAGTSYQDHFPGWGVSWSIMVNDDLCLTHRFKGGLHGPFNNTLWSGISYVTGHQHKQQCYPLTDLRGDRWGVDAGTLASIWSPHFRYLEAKPRNWRSGFVVLRFVDGKLRHPEFLRVIDEKRGLCEFRGQDFVA